MKYRYLKESLWDDTEIDDDEIEVSHNNLKERLSEDALYAEWSVVMDDMLNPSGSSNFYTGSWDDSKRSEINYDAGKEEIVIHLKNGLFYVEYEGIDSNFLAMLNAVGSEVEKEVLPRYGFNGVHFYFLMNYPSSEINLNNKIPFERMENPWPYVKFNGPDLIYSKGNLTITAQNRTFTPELLNCLFRYFGLTDQIQNLMLLGIEVDKSLFSEAKEKIACKKIDTLEIDCCQFDSVFDYSMRNSDFVVRNIILSGCKIIDKPLYDVLNVPEKSLDHFNRLALEKCELHNIKGIDRYNPKWNAFFETTIMHCYGLEDIDFVGTAKVCIDEWMFKRGQCKTYDFGPNGFRPKAIIGAPQITAIECFDHRIYNERTNVYTFNGLYGSKVLIMYIADKYKMTNIAARKKIEKMDFDEIKKIKNSQEYLAYFWDKFRNYVIED